MGFDRHCIDLGLGSQEDWFKHHHQVGVLQNSGFPIHSFIWGVPQYQHFPPHINFLFWELHLQIAPLFLTSTSCVSHTYTLPRLTAQVYQRPTKYGNPFQHFFCIYSLFVVSERCHLRSISGLCPLTLPLQSTDDLQRNTHGENENFPGIRSRVTL